MARSCKVGKNYLKKTRYDNLLFSEFQLFKQYYVTPCVTRIRSLLTLSEVLEGGHFFPAESYDLPMSVNESMFLECCYLDDDF